MLKHKISVSRQKIERQQLEKRKKEKHTDKWIIPSILRRL